MPKNQRKSKLLPTLRTVTSNSAPRARSMAFYTELRRLILDGILGADDALPSSRVLATEAGLGRTAVESVLHRLSVEGLVQRVQGSGTKVSALLKSRTSSLAQLSTQSKNAHITPSDRGYALGEITACREPEVLMPFNAAVADVSKFPWTAWRDSTTQALRKHKNDILQTCEPAGLPMLRELIAQHLNLYRGTRAKAHQVVVFGSSQTALSALSQLLLNPGDTAAIEDPGYAGAHVAFKAAGAKLRTVPVDIDGVCTEHLHDSLQDFPRIVYCTPSHQYPTGVTMSLQRRIALLELAVRHKTCIIEDDYDGEFRYDSNPVPAIQGLMPDAPVAYLGTFSKVLFPGLRLAYAVVPTNLVAPLANIRSQIDMCPPTMLQATMCQFMETGELEAHIRKMLPRYAHKRDLMVQGIEDYRLGVMTTVAQAGLHMTAQLPRQTDAAAYKRLAEAIRAQAIKAKLAIEFTADFSVASGICDTLFLRYGGLSEDQIHKGLRTLDHVLRTALKT
jgi:GntR family transcriptional regulator / MocR family aminotransferase